MRFFRLSLARLHNETTLPGAEDGKSMVAVARIFQQWIERDINEVMAAHSTFSFDFDGWDSTVHHYAPDPCPASALPEMRASCNWLYSAITNDFSGANS